MARLQAGRDKKQADLQPLDEAIENMHHLNPSKPTTPHVFGKRLPHVPTPVTVQALQIILNELNHPLPDPLRLYKRKGSLCFFEIRILI